MPESPRITELQQKFEDNPRRFFASLANEYRKAGDFARAISICRIYIEKQPTHMAGHVVLGQALHAAGKMDEAEEIFQIVLALDPENLVALKCLGDIAQARGDLQHAHENFRQVLTADPRDHDTNNRLKTVEQALKLAASKLTEDWIPPRTSDEFLVPPGSPGASPPDRLVPVEFPEVEASAEVPAASEKADFPTLDGPVEREDIPEDDIEYRTAEFSVTSQDASELETAETSSEVESELEALMEDVAEAPEPEGQVPHYDHPMRTGEYSLSHDTSEWNRESREQADSPPAGAAESGDEAGTVEPAGPFITETVAELYLQQGFTGEALLVYRQLARSQPEDVRIAGRIAALEDRLADEHAARQAALDTPSPEPETEPESEPDPFFSAQPVYSPPESIPAFEKNRQPDFEEFDRAWAPPAPAERASDNDDWFAGPDIAPARPRQTVHEFFAVLGKAKAEIRRKPARVRVSADDIRHAADITAGFGAFGTEPHQSVPKPIIQPLPGSADPQDDVRRFRVWLDGLSDS